MRIKHYLLLIVISYIVISIIVFKYRNSWQTATEILENVHNVLLFQKIDEYKEITEICTGCKTEWVSMKRYPYTKEHIKDCPNCPSDYCYEAAGLILALATYQEIVNHQPDNIEVKTKLDKCIKKLEEHMIECKECKKSKIK